MPVEMALDHFIQPQQAVRRQYGCSKCREFCTFIFCFRCVILVFVRLALS
jgi:hypothetical protein